MGSGGVNGAARGEDCDGGIEALCSILGEIQCCECKEGVTGARTGVDAGDSAGGAGPSGCCARREGSARNREIMTEKSGTFRNSIFCVLIFLACYLVAWPVANMPLNDGWSYIKTAEVFAATGQIVYNGWAAPILGWMIPWGALFIKAFGFSFMTVKLSMLPVAAATLLLFHAVLRRFEIGAWNAVIGTLTLGLSPLFLPWTASFMTDIPGLFVIVLCLFLCQRAMDAGSTQITVFWLVLAAVSSAVGGTARQPAWLGVLVMVPCTGWLLRKSRVIFVAAVGLCAAGLGWVFVCVDWFARQPYAIPTPILPRIPHSWFLCFAHIVISLNMMGAEVLCLLVVVLPVLVAWLPKFGRRTDRFIALFCMGALPLLAVKLIFGPRGEIWTPDTLYRELSTSSFVNLRWHLAMQQSLVPTPVQFVVSLVALSAFGGFLIAIRDKELRAVGADRPAVASRIFWLLVPFSLSYFALLFLLSWQAQLYDRYMLDVMPGAIVVFLWFYQVQVRPRLPVYSVGLLAVYALLAVAGTHDWFASQRAELIAVRELRDAGVPRTEFIGGFAYDGWTQVGSGGEVNSPKIILPKGAFRPRTDLRGFAGACRYPFLVGASVIHPRYAVSWGPKQCYQRSRFPAVHYTAWIPPFRRTVYVEKIGGNGR